MLDRRGSPDGSWGWLAMASIAVSPVNNREHGFDPLPLFHSVLRKWEVEMGSPSQFGLVSYQTVESFLLYLETTVNLVIKPTYHSVRGFRLSVEYENQIVNIPLDVNSWGKAQLLADDLRAIIEKALWSERYGL